MMETATALQSDLDRLNRESRGRSCTHNQSSSQCRMHGPVVGGGCIPEVHAWPIPKGDQKIGQGPKAKIAIKHIS